MFRLTGLFVLAIAVGAGCGGAAAQGEACDTPGATDDECEEGAVCDVPEGESDPICLATCEDQEDCAADEACNGVTGSNVKACHPKEDGGKK